MNSEIDTCATLGRKDVSKMSAKTDEKTPELSGDHSFDCAGSEVAQPSNLSHSSRGDAAHGDCATSVKKAQQGIGRVRQSFFGQKEGLLNTGRVAEILPENEEGSRSEGTKNDRVRLNSERVTDKNAETPVSTGRVPEGNPPKNAGVNSQPAPVLGVKTGEPDPIDGVSRHYINQSLTSPSHLPGLQFDHFPPVNLDRRLSELSARVLKGAEVIPFDPSESPEGAAYWHPHVVKFMALQNELDVLLHHHEIGMPYSRLAWRGIRAFPIMTRRWADIFRERVNLYRDSWGQDAAQVLEDGQVLRFAGTDYVVLV